MIELSGRRAFKEANRAKIQQGYGYLLRLAHSASDDVFWRWGAESKMLDESELQLSAERAFLGSIYPEMRAVRIRAEGHDIILSVILDKEPSEIVREAISAAASEISDDFPGECDRVVEDVVVNPGPITDEDGVSWSCIYERSE